MSEGFSTTKGRMITVGAQIGPESGLCLKLKIVAQRRCNTRVLKTYGKRRPRHVEKLSA